MKVITKIACRIGRFAIGLFVIYYMIYAGVTTAYVIDPSIKPWFTTGSGWNIGFNDYRQGIPVKMSAKTPIPDSSFNLRIDFPDSSTEFRRYITRYGDTNSSDRNRYVGATVRGDTIATQFLGTDGKVNPDIRAASISGVTAYAWKPTFGERLWLLLPELLIKLLVIFCCIQVSRHLRDIIKEQAFARNRSRRSASIGAAIIAVQLVFAAMEFTKSWGPRNIQVHYWSSVHGAHVPFDMPCTAIVPFDITILALGCVILGLAGFSLQGQELKKQKDKLQEEKEDLKESLAHSEIF
jgi:hypothetical protein